MDGSPTQSTEFCNTPAYLKRRWTDEDKQFLREHFAEARDCGKIAELAAGMHRSLASLYAMAGAMSLTDRLAAQHARWRRAPVQPVRVPRAPVMVVERRWPIDPVIHAWYALHPGVTPHLRLWLSDKPPVSRPLASDVAPSQVPLGTGAGRPGCRLIEADYERIRCEHADYAARGELWKLANALGISRTSLRKIACRLGIAAVKRHGPIARERTGHE